MKAHTNLGLALSLSAARGRRVVAAVQFSTRASRPLPHRPNDYSNLAWTCAALTFTAANEATVIELQSENPDNGGVYLDSFLIKPL